MLISLKTSAVESIKHLCAINYCNTAELQYLLKIQTVLLKKRCYNCAAEDVDFLANKRS